MGNFCTKDDDIYRSNGIPQPDVKVPGTAPSSPMRRLSMSLQNLRASNVNAKKNQSTLGSLTDEELADAAKKYTVMNKDVRRSHPGITLSLALHKHTLQCERKEKVCASMGKLQQLEHIDLNIDTSKLSKEGLKVDVKKVLWLRSPRGGNDEASQCDHKETVWTTVSTFSGKNRYTLGADDIGCYIVVQVPLTSGSYHGPSADSNTETRVSVSSVNLSEKNNTSSHDDGDTMLGDRDGEGEDALLESAAMLGPVLPSPPRLSEFIVVGQSNPPQPGQFVMGTYCYQGGFEGCSEFGWMRVNKGVRTQLNDNMPLLPKHLESPPEFDSKIQTLTVPHADDPRLYKLTQEDVGCTLKVRCRPVRSDNYRGEVFTSKPSMMVAH